MFQIFGDEIYDSSEIAKILDEKYQIHLISDLTKSLSKQDAMAFKVCIKIDKLNIRQEDLMDEQTFLECLKICDDYVSDVVKNLKIKYSLDMCKSYKYDEYNKNIKCIICIMHINSARKKLNDTMKRLLKNND